MKTMRDHLEPPDLLHGARSSFQPFPVEALPEPVAGYIQAGATAIGCDASFLALPMLTALGSAIGNTRHIELKSGWTAPPTIWTAIVGESGTAKTPAFKLVMKPIRERQGRAFEAHVIEMQQFDLDYTVFEKDLAIWKRRKTTAEPPPQAPQEPQAIRFIVGDTTLEALAPILLHNPRGIILALDELAGWFNSFDRYSNKAGGSESAQWLSLFNSEAIVVDRKSGRPKTIYIPSASVAVTGGIQPTILHRALGVEHRESGLAARLLVASPPRRAKSWTETNISPAAEQQIAALFDRLYELDFEIDEHGKACPLVARLSAKAKEVWVNYYQRHAAEHAELCGDLAAAWSKLEEYAARFALVIHYVRWSCRDTTVDHYEQVDEASMEAGVHLADWFKCETKRVYEMLAESDDERARRNLVELIQRKGGKITARDLMRSSRKWKSAEEAEAQLNELVCEGYGRWWNQPSESVRGRKARVFELCEIEP